MRGQSKRSQTDDHFRSMTLEAIRTELNVLCDAELERIVADDVGNRRAVAAAKQLLRQRNARTRIG